MKKRLLAKLIDMMFVSTILFLPVFSYIFAIKAIEIAYTPFARGIIYMPLVLIVYIVLFIYFGVVGAKQGGSIGKSFCNINIDGKNKAFQLFIREPLCQIILLSIIYEIVFHSFILSFFLMCTIYIMALFLKVDLWNRIYKNEVL